MSDPAQKLDQALPAEIVEALKTAGIAPKTAALLSIIQEFCKAKAEAKRARIEAQPAEEMLPVQALVLPIKGSHFAGYQKALRAAKRGQLEATKIGGRWFCTRRAMNEWRANTGQGSPDLRTMLNLTG